jgi:hypothetical protein
MSSDSEEQAPTRKRSRTSEEGGGGAKEGKKARGRPRVDTQDATAADVSDFKHLPAPVRYRRHTRQFRGPIYATPSLGLDLAPLTTLHWLTIS